MFLNVMTYLSKLFWHLLYETTMLLTIVLTCKITCSCCVILYRICSTFVHFFRQEAWGRPQVHQDPDYNHVQPREFSDCFQICTLIFCIFMEWQRLIELIEYLVSKKFLFYMAIAEKLSKLSGNHKCPTFVLTYRLKKSLLFLAGSQL